MGLYTPEGPMIGCANGFPPRLFLIGAQKCATTFFADSLARHPQIVLASPKEPDFFTRNHNRGADWYRACFQPTGDAVLLDASVSYSVAPQVPDPMNPVSGVPERIRAMVPDAYFLYIVRDPVKRVHSAYWHAVTAGHERRPFRQAVAEDPWYLNASRYHRQVTRYLDVFPANRLLILEMRDVVSDPDQAVARVCAHIGLSPPALAGLSLSKRNASYRLNALGRLLTHGGLGRGFPRCPKAGGRASGCERTLPRARRPAADGPACLGRPDPPPRPAAGGGVRRPRR